MVTELGIVTEVKPEQPLNACEPIVVTEFGIVIEVKLVHPWNAELHIDETMLPIINVFNVVLPSAKG